MTAVSHDRPGQMPAASLAEYSDETLAHWYGASTSEQWHATLEAEMMRRDAEQAAKPDPRQVQRDEWERMAHAQWLDAERACRGELLNARGMAAGIDPWSLWSGPAHRTEIYASEELRGYWRDVSPRIDITTYQRQASGERRAWLDRHDREAVSSDQLGPDDTGSVRQAGAESAAVAVPGAGPVRDRGSRGPADRPGGRVSDTTTGRLSDELARRAARIRALPGSGSAEPGGDETAGVIVPPAANGPSAGAVALRNGGTVARSPRADDIAAETMRYAHRVLTRHVSWPSQSALDTVLLWCFHANARDRDENGTGPLIWRASPRLLLTSKVRGSGKSTALDLIAMLTGSRFGRLPRVTAPGFAKLMGKFQEPAILDEARMIFGSGQKSLDLQGMLLAGYTPRSHSLTGRDGGTAEKLFGPVAYAGKDNLITSAGDGVSDLLDRSFVIRMTRPARHYPDVDEVAEQAAELACQGMGTWSAMMRDQLMSALKNLEREAMLADLDEDEVEGGALRAAQIWRPLLAIADCLGGDWPERARTACEQLSMPGGEYDQWRESLDGLSALWDETGEDELS